MEFWPANREFGRGSAMVTNAIEEMASDDDPVTFEIALAHLMQCAHNWPTYKVWPEYVEMLANMPLTNVPLRLVKTPFPAFSVCLPKSEHGLLCGGRPLKGMIVYSSSPEDSLHAIRKLTEMFPSLSKDTRETLLAIGTAEDHSKRFSNYLAKNRMLGIITEELDLEKAGDVPLFMQGFTTGPHLAEDPEITVEKAITRAKEYLAARPDVQTAETDPFTEEERTRLWRFVIALSFLAIGQHRVVQPDVLTADMRKYVEALNADDETTIERLHDKAMRRRNGERGWTVGRMHSIVVGQTKSADEPEPSGRQLKHQHMRSAHYHAYWCGPGREERVVKFVLNTVVRPDLPIRDGGEGPDRVVRI